MGGRYSVIWPLCIHPKMNLWTGQACLASSNRATRKSIMSDVDDMTIYGSLNLTIKPAR